MNGNHPHYVRVRDTLKALETDADSNRAEVELHVRGRAHSYVLKSIRLIQEDKPIGTLIILQDVTYIRDQERARTNLFATLSHELRTPLTSILITAQTLDRQKASLPLEQQKLVEIAVEESKRMNQLIDSLLNLAQGQSPSISTRRERIELGEIVVEARKQFEIQAKEKHISLDTRVEGSTVVSADRVKLAWVISNLIGNALRYTPEGGKIVVACAGEYKLVRLEVADTGPGIPPEIRDHVFEPLAQYSVSGYDPDSTGIGLAIVRDIVEAHGGRISIESNHGSGSRFIVLLPAFQEI